MIKKIRKESRNIKKNVRKQRKFKKRVEKKEICDCGGVYGKRDRKRHLATKTHQKFEKEKEM